MAERLENQGRTTSIPQHRRKRPAYRQVDAKIPALGPLPPFFTIGTHEYYNVATALRYPLSGYLGGKSDTGYWIKLLSDQWREVFNCEHAIPCNSATSGLLAACLAIGIKPGDTVWVPSYTMSATAACAKVLGAHLEFIDIETLRYAMNLKRWLRSSPPTAIIVTNLFGHPAYLAATRLWCDLHKVWMIEDNAQSPFAKEGGRYAGTFGHLGVFSLNVHKHIQAGEGGVVVTDKPDLAEAVRHAINHGELASRHAEHSLPKVGLNLRMAEPIAAIASAQLARAGQILAGRIALAEELTDMFTGPGWLVPPVQDKGCKHVYYLWAARVGGGRRNTLCGRLNSLGFPMRAGYSPPLNRIFNPFPFTKAGIKKGMGFIYERENACPVAERLEDEQLITFEVCAYDPSAKQRKRMREIAKHVVGSFHDE